MAKKVKTFTVSRRRWIRGEYDAETGRLNNSFLYREGDKKMCCLGFLAKASGAKVGDIFNCTDPTEANNKVFSWPAGIFEEESGDNFLNSKITEKLMEVNDDAELTSREREKKLRELFKEIGIKVKFVP